MMLASALSILRVNQRYITFGLALVSRLVFSLELNKQFLSPLNLEGHYDFCLYFLPKVNSFSVELRCKGTLWRSHAFLQIHTCIIYTTIWAFNTDQVNQVDGLSKPSMTSSCPSDRPLPGIITVYSHLDQHRSKLVFYLLNFSIIIIVISRIMITL